jgi:hypothetical protein
MVKEMMGAWASLLDATQITTVLNGGKLGVYRFIADKIQDYARANVPAYQTAITVCDVGAQAATGDAGSCSKFARDLLVNLVRDAAKAIGLDKLIESVLKAWQMLPEEIRAMLDAQTYNKVSDFLIQVESTSLPRIIDASKYVTDFISARAEYIEREFGSLKSVVPSGFSVWLASLYDGAADYAEDLVRDTISRTTSIPSGEIDIVIGPLGGLAVTIGGDAFDFVESGGLYDAAEDLWDVTGGAAIDATETVYEYTVGEPLGWVASWF